MTLLLSDLFDAALLDEMLTAGYVKRQVHPTLPLAILNYSAGCQWAKAWNTVTRQCRGLIYNTETGEVVARPFPKFFNLGELTDDEIPTGPFRVLDKLDGSLGVLYSTGDSWAVATRGSFISEQAIHATAILRSLLTEWTPLPGLTYLFEIIYPANRIVVDYGQRDELVLLEALDTATHRSVDAPWPARRVSTFPDIGSPQDAADLPDRPNTEGYVLRFDSGERVKVKADEYVRLHRILTGVSDKTIWEYLSTGWDLAPLIERVPDEFHEWVDRTMADLISAYDEIVQRCARDYPFLLDRGNADTENPRRGFARAIVTHPYKAVLFRMLDGKDYADNIWKLVKPAGERPFRLDEQ